MAKLVANVYGDALFSIGKEKNTLDDLYEEVLAVKTAFDETPQLMDVLVSPDVNGEQKQELLARTFQGRVSYDMFGFLSIVVKKSRQEYLDDMFAYFISTYKEEKKIGVVSVTTPFALSESKKFEIQKKLLQTTGYRSLEITYSVDESLIGGMVIRIKDRVVDSSVKTRLKELEKSLRGLQIGE
ncbi:MAG: F0F1 ATP synthase subunit delta [Lachnospiraceae bacterium]|nr:F0F1 ATP synthase subunit delta [Lachnospiraceae bacterium]